MWNSLLIENYFEVLPCVHAGAHVTCSLEMEILIQERARNKWKSVSALVLVDSRRTKTDEQITDWVSLIHWNSFNLFGHFADSFEKICLFIWLPYLV